MHFQTRAFLSLTRFTPCRHCSAKKRRVSVLLSSTSSILSTSMTFRPFGLFLFLLTFAAFLNETGLSFVKKCIALIETRGTSASHRCCRELRNLPVIYRNLLLLPVRRSDHARAVQDGRSQLQSAAADDHSVRYDVSTGRNFLSTWRRFRCCGNVRTQLRLACFVSASTASPDVQLDADAWDNKTITSGLKDYFR